MTVKHDAWPNWTGNCKACGSFFERYVRACKPEPKFCSSECYQSTMAGRTLSEEHKVKIGLTRQREKHPLWKGDKASIRTGRCRAQNWFASKPCEICGASKSERHHADGNTLNNDPSNIQHLCRRCHMTVDGRIENVANRRKKNEA